MEKLYQFIDNKFTDLIQIYITERQKHGNELGALFLFLKLDKVDIEYFSISDPLITEELKNDIINKNNNRNSQLFLLLINVATNETQLLIKDLEK